MFEIGDIVEHKTSLMQGVIINKKKKGNTYSYSISVDLDEVCDNVVEEVLEKVKNS